MNKQTTDIQVFWQPGCSSCLRTKEFLTKQGVAFESIDVHNDAEGRARLLALGARTVPVVARAGKFTYCQTMKDVIAFLQLDTTMNEPLSPQVLKDRLILVITAAVRFTRQMPAEFAFSPFRDRDRSFASTAFHTFRVAEMGIEAARQIELRSEGFREVPPSDWTTGDIALWGEAVASKVADWWDEPGNDRGFAYTVPTYYGTRPMHEVFERTVWHAAQHTRQLMLMLESYGVTPDRPLTETDLAGLPMPDSVW
ncbi:glutaredoxin domain-containing protein [Xinfangfangia pollutisoli]|uniref:glutaredoxin domain-containing protein n=1 Tax=Xinfangfangia pollutisoli TaxID=2865960 RepID=UPI001CD61848|nr:glutaredoxin domain-containing protein [Xinfangfangia pollutisoli]